MASLALVERLEAVAGRLEAVAARLEAAGVGGLRGGGGGAAAVELPMYVMDWDQMISENLPPLLAASERLEFRPTFNEIVQQCYDRLTDIIYATAFCKKPSNEDFQAYFQPIMEAAQRADGIKNKRNMRKGVPKFHKFYAAQSIANQCSWVFYSPEVGMLPAAFAETEHSSTVGQAFAFKQCAESDDQEGLKEWYSAVRNLTENHLKYIKANFATGLSWNPQGDALSEFDRSSLNTGGAAASGGGARQAAVYVEGPPPHIAEFDAFVAENLGAVLAASSALDFEPEFGEILTVSYNRMGDILHATTSCKKPSNEEFQAYFQPVMEAAQKAMGIKDERGNRKGVPKFHKFFALQSMVTQCSWVFYSPEVGMLPAAFAETEHSSTVGQAFAFKQASADSCDAEALKTWYTAVRALTEGLSKYVKANFATGLSWNPQGGNLSEYSRGGDADATESKNDS